MESIILTEEEIKILNKILKAVCFMKQSEITRVGISPKDQIAAQDLVKKITQSNNEPKGAG